MVIVRTKRHTPPPIYPSLCVCAHVSTPSASTPHATPLSPRHAAAGHPSATLHGAGQRLSRPMPGHPHAHPATQQPRTRQQRPHQRREHASKQAGAKGRTQPHCPHHPQASAPTPKHANTKRRTRPARKHETQPPASKHAHSKPQQVRPQANTRNVPTPTRVGTPSVSAGGPAYLQRRPARSEAQTTNAGTQDNAHKSAQTTWFAYGVRLRPQGRTARERAAHNSPRQSAWVECVCGRVCGRLSAFLC